MPKVAVAFLDWTVDITLEVVSQVNTQGFITSTTSSLKFKCSIQPLEAEQLKFKPEGQRSWEWLQIHVVSKKGFNLKTTDKIIYNGKVYKVMLKKDYSLNGYVEYHIMGDYQ